jgi:hypothetical protein
MKYADGQEVKLGDTVRLANDVEGQVVCSIDNDEYTPEFPKADWEYQKRGAMFKFPTLGLVHYEQTEPDLELVGGLRLNRG